MANESMRQFRFEGTTLAEIHSWMQASSGLKGVTRAVENLEGMARDLQHSQESLKQALQRIGVGWEGTAADGAGSSVGESETWSVEATPIVVSSTGSTQNVGDDFRSTRSRMPTPAEAELTDAEHAAANAVPIFGPTIDRALADAKLDKVTDEARLRMNEWQDSANASVGSVQPLPLVPSPVVDAAPTKPVGTEVIDVPGATRSVTGPPLPGPGPVGPSGPPPVVTVPPPGPLPGGPPLPPTNPPPIGTPPGGPPTPGPGGPPVGQPVQPGRPSPFLPLPIGGLGPGGGTAEGRRRAFGPGMYSSDEIAKSRGAGGQAPGVAENAKPRAGVPAEGAAGRSAAAAGRGGAGGVLQPAVGAGAGAGARGEDDQEHSDKYADKTDEHFTEGIQRVAPPVIGG